MELAGEIIQHLGGQKFCLRVTFTLATKEFQSNPLLSLTDLGKRELAENISTIEYGLTGTPLNETGDVKEYELKTKVHHPLDTSDPFILNIVMNRVELTQDFIVVVNSENVSKLDIIEDIERMYEEEVVPGFRGPNESLKIARL